MDICIFCFQGKDNPKPFCHTNPGNGCTFGFYHDFGDGEFGKPTSGAVKQPVKKIDKQVCVKCNLHIKKPASATNGCEHEYPT